MILVKFIKQFKFHQILVLFAEEYIGLLIRFIPSVEGMFLRWIFYKLTFKRLGKFSLIYSNVFITHGYNITAGHNLAINCGSHIDGRGGIYIGDYVLIGPNVFIGSSNHHIDSLDDEPRLFLGHIKKSVIIGSNVWIGANCVICPGVSIGNNSVIGAGSIVTKDIEESVIVAGNPAVFKKTIKKNLQNSNINL